MPAGISPSTYTHTDTRAADLFMESPTWRVFLSGTFVAQSSTVTAEIDASGTIYGATGSAVGWQFLYANNSVSGQLLPTTQAAALGAGITEVDLPFMGSWRGNLAGAITLTGLSVGTTYKYELCVGIVGGGAATSLHPQNPYRVACSAAQIGGPRWNQVVAVQMSTTDLAIIASQRLFGFSDEVLGTVVLPNGSGGQIDISPDGTRVVRTSQTQASPQSIWIVNTGVPTTAKSGDDLGYPWIFSTITLAANEIAHGVAITPDNTRAWVCFQGSSGRYSTIQPIDMVTGAITTPNMAAGTLGATGANPWDIVIDSTGTYAYVSLNGLASNNIKKVTLATGTVAATGSVGGALAAAGVLALSPDNTKLYVVSGITGGNIYTLNTSDLSLAGTKAMPSTVHAEGCEIFPDGLCLMIASSETGVGGRQIYQYEPATDVFYTQWVLSATAQHAAYDIALGPYGDIWVPDFTNQSVQCWPGCRFNYTRSPAGNTTLMGGTSAVRFIGAT